MNDFSKLEAELKQLRPSAPSAELVSRVERALAQPATATGGVLPRPQKSAGWSWFSLGLGAAAVAAALLLLARPKLEETAPAQPTVAAVTPTTQNAIAARNFVPEGVTRVVYDTRDEGLIFPEGNGAPVRRIRARSRETLQWRDRQSGASLRVSYPTEEVEFIPVSGQ